jgi:hypothetical protein
MQQVVKIFFTKKTKLRRLQFNRLKTSVFSEFSTKKDTEQVMP